MYRASRGKTRNVKTLIMDAKVVVGVGNIYANEALYLSGIKPTATSGRMSKARVSSAWRSAIQAVLTKAIQAGGTSLRDFLKEDGTPRLLSP